MHNLLQKVIPHILMVMALLGLPAQIAIYVFVVFYTLGVFINIKKERELTDAKNNSSEHKWWQVLGTDETTDITECARVRKLLSKIYHPDGGQAPNAAAMSRINEAFETRAALPDNANKIYAEPEHIN
ncbi:MAG: hypothetical protein ACI9TY_001233 [Alphaproteobacteria bacterium]|jgi:hypothetical protein